MYDQKASVEIGNGIVLFKFEKQVSALWSDLEHANKSKLYVYIIKLKNQFNCNCIKLFMFTQIFIFFQKNVHMFSYFLNVH